MRALLVTSAVTFVPDNYNRFINAMAECEHIAGLLVINNRSWPLLLKALRLASGYAPQLGRTLINNHRPVFKHQREQLYRQFGKPVWYADSVNHRSVHQLIESEDISLVINARTRCIYHQGILQLPRLGCINIHHGLLPHQRGTLCDLWALIRGHDAGFSIHKMTGQLDDGELLRVVTTSRSSDHNYLNYLARSSQSEVECLTQLLSDIAETGSIIGTANTITTGRQYDKDPTWEQFRSLKRSSIEV